MIGLAPVQALANADPGCIGSARAFAFARHPTAQREASLGTDRQGFLRLQRAELRGGRRADPQRNLLSLLRLLPPDPRSAYLRRMERDFAYWRRRLREAERELDAATKRTELNLTARGLPAAESEDRAARAGWTGYSGVSLLPPDLPPNSVAQGEKERDAASNRGPKTRRNPDDSGQVNTARDVRCRFHFAVGAPSPRL
jgi:hypothetical protein